MTEPERCPVCGYSGCICELLGAAAYVVTTWESVPDSFEYVDFPYTEMVIAVEGLATALGVGEE